MAKLSNAYAKQLEHSAHNIPIFGRLFFSLEVFTKHNIHFIRNNDADISDIS